MQGTVGEGTHYYSRKCQAYHPFTGRDLDRLGAGTELEQQQVLRRKLRKWLLPSNQPRGSTGTTSSTGTSRRRAIGFLRKRKTRRRANTQ